MSFEESTIISGIKRSPTWILRGLKWSLASGACSIVYLIIAAGQTPLGPKFNLAVIAALVAGIPTAVLLNLLLEKIARKIESAEESQRIQWRNLSRRRYLILAGILITTIIAFVSITLTWTLIRDSRTISKAATARQEFEIFTHGNDFEQSDVNQTLAELQEAHNQLRKELPEPIRKFSISVHLFRDLQQYRAFTGQPWASGSAQCGASETAIAIPLEESLGILADNYHSYVPMHEMVHALMCQTLGEKAFYSVPAWFHEGIATMYQTDGLPKVETAISRIHLWIKQDGLIKPQVFCTGSSWESRDQARLFYRTSLEFVRALESQHGKDELISVMKALQNQGTFDESLRNQFGATCEELYSRWLTSW